MRISGQINGFPGIVRMNKGACRSRSRFDYAARTRPDALAPGIMSEAQSRQTPVFLAANAKILHGKLAVYEF